LYSTNPRDDLAALRRRLGERVGGTCEWILHRPEFREWLTSHSKAMLRLVGEPGIGKSMRSSFLVARLEKDCLESENAIFVYYFFDNKVESRRTASMLLRTLLLQLLEQVPSLFQHIGPDYQKMGRELVKDFDALWRILIAMLQSLQQTQQVWILIDAVDECDEDRTSLLQSLRDWIAQASVEKNTRLKFLLTHRP
jgi:NACHT domain